MADRRKTETTKNYNFAAFKFTTMKWFLKESAKCQQKIVHGQTDESKHLGYGHILKAFVKVLKEKF